MTSALERLFETPPAEALIEMHSRALARDGGASGIRDEGALAAALARPQNLLAYAGEDCDTPRLAVAVAYSIARIRHPFVDGNKRMGFLALTTTLIMNGLMLDVSETQAAHIMISVAAGHMSEDAFAEWVASNCVNLVPPMDGT